MQYRSRKPISLITGLVFAVLGMNTTLAQDMPPGGVIVTTACLINEGHSVNDVIEVARAIPVRDGGPNFVFYRTPIAANGAPPNLILRVVYWDSMEHWATANSGGGSGGVANARAHLSNMLDCDTGNRTFSTNRNVGQGGVPYGNGENDFSLAATRACDIKPGNTIADVYAFLSGFSENFRGDGDTTLMQLTHHFMGTNQNVGMGSRVLIRLVGEDPVGLARRLDLNGKPVGPGEGSPLANCRNQTLWASYVTHWGGLPQ